MILHYFGVANFNNRSCSACGAGTAFPSGVHEFSLVFFFFLVWFVLSMQSHYLSSCFQFHIVISDQFPRKIDVQFIFTPICHIGSSCFICYLYLFTYTCVLHDFHIKRGSCRLTIARRVSHVEQELKTIPEHLSFSGIRVVRSFDLCVKICRSLFVLFLLAFVL